MTIPVSDFDLDMLMALRYAYYVKHVSIVPDVEYDRMEAEYAAVNGPLPSVGSDRAEDYTPAQRALALYFLLTGRFTAPPVATNGEELL